MRNVTIGMDLGDKKHVITILDEDGVITKSCSLNNTRASIIKYFKKYQGSTVAIEAGTLFCLTLSDISADIKSPDIKRRGQL